MASQTGPDIELTRGNCQSLYTICLDCHPDFLTAITGPPRPPYLSSLLDMRRLALSLLTAVLFTVLSSRPLRDIACYWLQRPMRSHHRIEVPLVLRPAVGRGTSPYWMTWHHVERYRFKIWAFFTLGFSVTFVAAELLRENWATAILAWGFWYPFCCYAIFAAVVWAFFLFRVSRYVVSTAVWPMMLLLVGEISSKCWWAAERWRAFVPLAYMGFLLAFCQEVESWWPWYVCFPLAWAVAFYTGRRAWAELVAGLLRFLATLVEIISAES
ncbi:hypothetical protein B0T25DRAFT_568608 [Lasiosphaeria hispida]|uniref:Uncharacterized protein n=1 Tax=Lasiosphaeria hispida TaxID=260671 RepID=A0AAJ0HIM5_9PEZI|nr:hypothetical protein B0T25DRAFT_568608 [Lasiosphaeria hispida]